MAKSKCLTAATGMAALLLAGAAFAQHAAKDNKDAKDNDDARVPPGLAAGVDSAGRLRPVTSDEARALVSGMARWLDQSSTGLVRVYHPNGAVSIDLDDRFHSVSLARVRVDGRPQTYCAGSLDEAMHFLGQSGTLPVKRVAPTAALEEK